MGDGRTRYEAKVSKDHHDHMICLETGKIIEFFNEDLEKLQDKIAKEYGYKVISREKYINGKKYLSYNLYKINKKLEMEPNLIVKFD